MAHVQRELEGARADGVKALAAVWAQLEEERDRADALQAELSKIAAARGQQLKEESAAVEAVVAMAHVQRELEAARADGVDLQERLEEESRHAKRFELAESVGVDALAAVRGQLGEVRWALAASKEQAEEGRGKSNGELERLGEELEQTKLLVDAAKARLEEREGQLASQKNALDDAAREAAEVVSPDPKPYTLHPAPCTLHPSPCNLHLTPRTLNPSGAIADEGGGGGHASRS